MTVQPLTQAALAYLCLENLIVTLELAPDTIIPERELIALTGFGRTPIREAMQRLAWEGLIEVRPRSGIKIIEIRMDDFTRVLELRLLLEPRLVSAAAHFASDMHRSQINQCRLTMENSAEENNIKIFLAADKTFDTVMSNVVDNRFLTNILGPLQTHSRRFWYRFLAERGLSWSAKGHMQVMQGIIDNNPDAAEEAMKVLMQGLLDKAKALTQYTQ